jgi:hypothetical protein
MKKLLALAAGLCLLAPAKMWAADIRINDLTDTITVTANDFTQPGFSVNGQQFQSGFNNSQSITVDESAGQLTFSGGWTTDGAAADQGSRTIYFLESPGGPVSDVFSYTWSIGGGIGQINGTFESDIDGTVLATVPSGAETYLESAGQFGFGLAFLTGGVTSDAEPVPLPSTAVGGIALLGGLGLVIAARRRPQQA